MVGPSPSALALAAAVLLLIAAVVAIPLARWMRARAGYPLAMLLGAAALLLTLLIDDVRAAPIEVSRPWIDTLGANFALRLDALGLVFALAITGVGAAVLGFSPRYLEEDIGFPRFYGALVGFAASMTVLVVAADALTLYLGWEGTTLTSYLLIASRPAGRVAARRALLVTFAGGLVLLAALLFAGSELGTLSLADLGEPARWPHPALGIFLTLLVIAAAVKSAQVPLHVWLPPAMVAPTPVSAYLHAAAMVTAGVYLLLRFAEAIAAQPLVAGAIVALGSATALFGAAVAMARRGLKELLAYSTISHLGMMIALIGLGTRGAILGALGYFVAHATYKSTLFLAAGAYKKQLHAEELPELAGAARRLPVVTAALVAGCVSMAGVLPTLGYVAKEQVIAGLRDQPVALVVIAAALGLTVAYSIRIAVAPFRRARGASPVSESAGLALPAAALALATVVLGIFAAQISPLLEAATEVAIGGAPDRSLKLWHGITAELGLSLLILLTGAVLFARWRQPWQRRFASELGPRVLEVAGRWIEIAGTLVRRSLENTRAGQLAIVFAASAAAILVAVGATTGELDSALLADSPSRWVVCVLVAGAAAAVIRAGDHISAFAALAVVGFLVAIWYLLHGAPQLAAVQLVVDCLTVALSLFVLRRLPRSLPVIPWARRAGAAAIAVAAGSAFAALSMVERAAGLPPASERYLASARAEGSGNLVSKILAEYRALDTLGETTVVAVAALGVVAVLRRRKERR